MGYRDDIIEYLKEKRGRAVGVVKATSSLNELHEGRKSVAKSTAQMVAPSLDMEKRKARAIQEVPSYHPSGVMSMTVGMVYEGIEVIIPVLGDMFLFNKLIGNRTICDGFSIEYSAIKIKQFDIAGLGIQDVRDRIKTCVESLQDGLVELKAVIDSHHATLESDLTNAVSERNQELVSKQQKDEAADPWG